MILAFVVMIIMFAAAALSLVDEETVQSWKDDLCALEFGGPDESLNQWAEALYQENVDKVMCTSVCNCPIEEADYWTSSEITLANYGRIWTESSMTTEEGDSWTANKDTSPN